MQYRLLITALYAAVAFAAPTQMAQERSIFGDIGHDISSGVKDVGHAVSTGAKDVGHVVSSGAKDVAGAAKTVATDIANCDIAKCAAALGPAAVSCGTAVANFVKSNPEIGEAAEDAGEVAEAAKRSPAAGAKAGAAGCLAGVVNDAANKPAACSKCF